MKKEGKEELPKIASIVIGTRRLGVHVVGDAKAILCEEQEEWEGALEGLGMQLDPFLQIRKALQDIREREGVKSAAVAVDLRGTVVSILPDEGEEVRGWYHRLGENSDRYSVFMVGTPPDKERMGGYIRELMSRIGQGGAKSPISLLEGHLTDGTKAS